jgi:Prephenate dehydratase
MTAPERYSYLGPEGTFTWEALRQVSAASDGEWVSVSNVSEALDDVVSGASTYAMIAVENSVEGGVSATQDALE